MIEKNIWNFQKEFDFWVDTFFQRCFMISWRTQKANPQFADFQLHLQKLKRKKAFSQICDCVWHFNDIWLGSKNTKSETHPRNNLMMKRADLSKVLLHSKCEDKVIVHWPIYIPKISQILCGSGFCILVCLYLFRFLHNYIVHRCEKWGQMNRKLNSRSRIDMGNPIPVEEVCMVWWHSIASAGLCKCFQICEGGKFISIYEIWFNK